MQADVRLAAAAFRLVCIHVRKRAFFRGFRTPGRCSGGRVLRPIYDACARTLTGRDKKETGRASSVSRTRGHGGPSRVQTWREQLYKCRKGERPKPDLWYRCGMRESARPLHEFLVRPRTDRGPTGDRPVLPIKASSEPNGISSIPARSV